MRVRTRELTMKNGAMPIRVSLPECEVLSTRTKYHAFATAHMPTRSQPCQRVGHSHQPFHILLNQGPFMFLISCDTDYSIQNLLSVCLSSFNRSSTGFRSIRGPDVRDRFSFI